MTQVGIVGTTGWATALGIVAAQAGNEAVLWARSSADADELQRARENSKLLPGVAFPAGLSVSADSGAALGRAEIVMVVVPSVTMRQNLAAIRSSISKETVVVCATKGIEVSTGKRMSELITEELAIERSRTGMISGPNFAAEIAGGKAASATVAFESQQTAETVQQALNTRHFRLYTSTDVTGVELGGALKNIVAIGAGFIDGLDLGANAKAAFVTRGLHEITRLGVSLGAKPETFAGLSGMGDMIATCYSHLSRNYRLGQALATGSTLSQALAGLGGTAEGVPTTEAAVRLAECHGVEMPIARTTRDVLNGDLKPEEAAMALMSRKPQPEVRY